MPKKPEVDQHPKKQQIIKALVRGVTYRKITEKYDVSQAALSRYLNDKLLAKAAKAQAQRDLRDGEGILREVERIMSRIQKMYDACDDYLQDAKDSSKYDLGPRGEDIEVTYIIQQDKKSIKRKESLQYLMNKIEGVEDPRITVLGTKYRIADPRKLILDTAAVLNKQLELLARIQGQIKDVSINIVNSPVWIELQQILLQVTDGMPKIRKQIAYELSSIAKSGGNA